MGPAKEMLETIDYQTSKVSGCLLSHVHGDHSEYIRNFMKYGIDVYTSDEVHSDIETVYGEKTKCLQRMKKYSIGSFDVIAFQVPHNDTECDGFLITHEGIGKLLFITDAEYCPYNFSKIGINHVWQNATILKITSIKIRTLESLNTFFAVTWSCRRVETAHTRQ